MCHSPFMAVMKFYYSVLKMRYVKGYQNQETLLTVR